MGQSGVAHRWIHRQGRTTWGYNNQRQTCLQCETVADPEGSDNGE